MNQQIDTPATATAGIWRSLQAALCLAATVPVLALTACDGDRSLADSKLQAWIAKHNMTDQEGTIEFRLTDCAESLALKGDSVREPQFEFTPSNMPATFLESISESVSGWRLGWYQVRWERVTKPTDERLVAWQFHNLKFRLNTVERSVAENLNFPMTLWSIQFEFDAVRTQTVAQRNLGLWSAWADRRPVRHLFEFYAVLGQSEVDTFHYVRLLPAGEFASFPSREASAAEVSEDLPVFPDGLFRLVDGSSDCAVFRHRK